MKKNDAKGILVWYSKQLELLMKKSRSFYLGINLMAPGLGQLMLKWYLRGLIELLGAVGCLAWAVWAVVKPFIDFYSSNPAQADIPQVNLSSVIGAVMLFILIWLWSFLEIILFFPKQSQSLDLNTE
ncbi:hypothetical protein P0136_13255 [Lentisphaerota bacterium ZTH]|nr:hypothetical protein JYG24_09230 [Lentisphaerota bacterium]WET06326.1 hypothetical protein P0136_13255 [Lentisphaerota bacterium ZTH]